MYRSGKLVALSAVLIIGSTGCQSHQAKVDALQQEYDRLGQQYRQDCSAEMLNVPPKLSPKCTDENKKVGDAWTRLQAERAKQ
jgi:uncharacterized protein HemX